VGLAFVFPGYYLRPHILSPSEKHIKWRWNYLLVEKLFSCLCQKSLIIINISAPSPSSLWGLTEMWERVKRFEIFLSSSKTQNWDLRELGWVSKGSWINWFALALNGDGWDQDGEGGRGFEWRGKKSTNLLAHIKPESEKRDPGLASTLDSKPIRIN
jgi:hypothetical protein